MGFIGKNPKRVLALLLAMSTLLSGCASSNIRSSLYADEIDVSTEVEEIAEVDNNVKEEQVQQEDNEEPQTEIEKEEKVLDLENEDYLDVENLSVPNGFEEEDEEYVYGEIDEDFKDVPSKGFLLKIEEGGTLMIMSEDNLQFLSSVWRDGDSVWYRDELTGAQYELEEIKDDYYCVPLSAGRHESGLLANEGYMVCVSSNQYPDDYVYSSYRDMVINTDGKSLVILDCTAVKGTTSKLRAASARATGADKGGTPTAEVTVTGKSPGADHTAAYVIEMTEGDIRTACCGLANKKGVKQGESYPCYEWVGANGQIGAGSPNVAATRSAVAMLTFNNRSMYVTDGGTNNAIGLFAKPGYEIPNYGFMDFARMHACLSVWMSDDHSYDRTAGLTSADIDAIGVACDQWATDHDDVLKCCTLNEVCGQAKDGTQNVYTIFYHNSDYVQIIKKWDPTYESVLKFPDGHINAMYADLTATFKIKNKSTNETVTVTTNSDGTSDPVPLKTGRYEIKETTPPPGYSVDKSTQEVVITSGCGTKEVTFIDKPKGDPSGIELHKKTEGATASGGKVDQLEGDIDYSKARFTVYYFENDKGKANTNLNKASKTWKFKPTQGEYTNIVMFDKEEGLVQGNYWKVSLSSGRETVEQILWMAGTYAIKETTNPPGTDVNDKIYYATLDYDNNWKWEEDYTTASDGKLIIKHSQPSQIYIENTPTPVGFTLKKYCRATGSQTPLRPSENLVFRHKFSPFHSSVTLKTE